MTEQEFDSLRRQLNNKSHAKQDIDSVITYFSYFKIRCLICLIILLSIFILDKQLDIKDRTETITCINMLSSETVKIKELFQAVAP